MQTNRVQSTWQAETSRRFRTAFMAAVDLLGPVQRLATWNGAEAVLGQDIRLVALHKQAVTHPLTGAIAFEGVFDLGDNLGYANLPMLRVTQGIKRHSSANYTADLASSGNLTWAMIRPVAGRLENFGSAALQTALDELLQLRSGSASWPDGEWVLPPGEMSLTHAPDRPLRQGGVTLAFDNTLANLKNLDGQGGTYVETPVMLGLWKASPSALSLSAEQQTVFRFNPLNIFSSGSGNFSTSFNQCNAPQPDTRSFFLVVLDAQGWVVQIAAVQSPPAGASCTLPIPAAE
jgi:hypothetical protein